MSNILNYALGILLVGALIVCGSFWVSNNSLEKELLTQKATISTLSLQKDALQASNNGLSDALTKQNESLAKLGEIQNTVSALFTNFNASVATTNKQIATIKTTIEKETTPTTCKDTIKYLKDARKEYK
ncbi:hypothetical protein D3C87_323370 [compost metagenome]